MKGRTIVVDIGKTNAKISLWSPGGELISRHLRANEAGPSTSGYQALDVQGIGDWLLRSMRDFAHDGDVARIVTVAHGAAAALVRNGDLFADPMDYEHAVDPEDRVAYDAQRDPFDSTGSPALPQGLNLGVQLHCLERRLGVLPEDVMILPWPQYWAWRFCGIPSSEVTSLGCHTDLWRPAEGRFSDLALRRGWAARMAPLRRAADTLGTITPELASATGLAGGCEVLCGVHDSNAALLAANGHPQIRGNDATVLSTGTWFVAMRSTPANTGIDIGELDELRDCLVNVDAYGRPTPSARFMGGREAELAGGVDSFRLTDSCEAADLLARLPRIIERDYQAIPGFVPGVGPFPNAGGSWVQRPEDSMDLRVATDVYLALVTSATLDLIGSRQRLLVEGRFAQNIIFTRTLAALRPQQRVYTSNAEHDVAYGALRLIEPDLPPASTLTPVEALEVDIERFAQRWRGRADSAGVAA